MGFRSSLVIKQFSHSSFFIAALEDKGSGELVIGLVWCYKDFISSFSPAQTVHYIVFHSVIMLLNVPLEYFPFGRLPVSRGLSVNWES